ncbi:DUF3631 domain-containing protein [bacterium]|nr:DUF3631 domain-containing protein [bacterium]
MESKQEYSLNSSQSGHILRPGISGATLKTAGVIQLTDGRIEIPYHDAEGNQSGFKRWRLPKPKGGQKYDQLQGSGSRAYTPPGLSQVPSSDSLVIVEGEFKALSLVEAGIPAIGLPSFGTYVNHDGEKILLEGILEVIQSRSVRLVYFIGDSDTATNPEFARNAHFLTESLHELGVEVRLPRIPLNGPGKGIDDCREALGNGFDDWWKELLNSSEEIDLKSSHWALANQLFEQELKFFLSLKGAEKTKHQRRVEEMIRKCDDKVQQGKLISIGSKALGVSKVELRSVVKADEAEGPSDELFKAHEPWGEAVTTEELLGEIVDLIDRHCYLPKHANVAVALWILNTYVYDTFSICPLIYLTSAAKRCGKTTLLELISSLGSKPLSTSNISTAALFRAIEKWKPTMIIDEADTFLGGSEELSGVINSGHRKSQAFTHRCVGDGANIDVQKFSTWCPKAIAGIGRIKDTTEDRSIVVEMERMPRAEKRAHFNPDGLSDDLLRKCVRWAADSVDRLADYQRFDKLPNDRANDNWTPLIAIAKLAGDEWTSQAVEAAQSLSQDQSGESMSTGEMVLSDIKAIIRERRWLKFRSTELVEALVSLEGRPWAEYGRQGLPISATKLAKLLKPFKVYPGVIRFSDGVARGYETFYFVEAFEKYVPSPPSSDRNSVTTPINKGDSTSPKCNTNRNTPDSKCNNVTDTEEGCNTVTGREESVTPCVTLPKPTLAANSKGCNTVTVTTGGIDSFFSTEAKPPHDLDDDEGEDEDLFAKLENGGV